MNGMAAILSRNLINFTRDKLKFIFTILTSIFFLFVFSFVMNTHVIHYNKPTNYLIAGIIIMTVFQSALINSSSILEDISAGFMKEIIVAPIKRWKISIGQILSATVIGVIQGLIIIIIGQFIGLNVSLIQFIEMVGVMFLAGITFSSMGLFLAIISKNSTTFQIMINVFVMPLTFLSGAYIPTTIIPKILIPFVYINPLTYITSLFRYISLKMAPMSNADLIKCGVVFNIDGFIIKPYMGLIITLLIYFVFFILCVRQFNKADFSKVKLFHHNK